MKIRLFIGNETARPLLEEWLKQSHPDCVVLGSAYFTATTYFQKITKESDEENLKSFLEVIKEVPSAVYNSIVLNVFITEAWISNVSIQETLATLGCKVQYYLIYAPTKDTIQFYFHHESSTFFPDPVNFHRLVGLKYEREIQFIPSYFYYPLGFDTYRSYICRPHIRKFCEEVKTFSENNSLASLIETATTAKPKLHKKVLSLIRKPNNPNLSALSFLLLWYNYQHQINFDENTFFNFIKSNRLIPFVNGAGTCYSNLYRTINFKTLLRVLPSRSSFFNNYLCFEDSVRLSSQYVDNFSQLQELTLGRRVRTLQQLHDILATESYYQKIFYEEKIETSFKLYQEQFKRISQANFIIPQTLMELKIQAKIFKNCSILYARDVSNARGFLGFLYKEGSPLACIFFDHHKNIIEISGLANRAVNAFERKQIQDKLYFEKF